MNRAFGKVFKSETGVEYGVIRKAKEPFPEVLSTSNVLAEDDCGNYFVLLNEAVCFWDHATFAWTDYREEYLIPFSGNYEEL